MLLVLRIADIFFTCTKLFHVGTFYTRNYSIDDGDSESSKCRLISRINSEITNN